MTPTDRAEHENNRDRCPIHHRPLTHTGGSCPACEADEQATHTVRKRAEYDGKVSVVGAAEALRGRTHARDARDHDNDREQADLWRYARGDR